MSDEDRRVSLNAPRPLPFLLGKGRWRADRAWWPWPWRAAILFAGVILPAGCLVLFNTPLRPHPRSTVMDVHAGLLFRWKASLPFYPLVFYSMVSLVLVVVRPERFAARRWVFFGLFTGALLTLHYLVLSAVVLFPDSLLILPLELLAGLVGVAVVWGASVIIRHHDGKAFLVIAILLTGLLLWLCWPLTLAAVLCCVTPWALTAYCVAAWRAVSKTTVGPFQFTLVQLLVLVTWVGVYLAALQLSILIATGN